MSLCYQPRQTKNNGFCLSSCIPSNFGNVILKSISIFPLNFVEEKVFAKIIRKRSHPMAKTANEVLSK